MSMGDRMKKILVIASVAFFANLNCLSAQAGLVNGAAKGIGKATKSVSGCVSRGAKGVGKATKSTFGGMGKAVKSVF